MSPRPPVRSRDACRGEGFFQSRRSHVGVRPVPGPALSPRTVLSAAANPTHRRTVLDRIWVEADRDGNGRATFGEFWQLVAATRSPTEEEMEKAYAFFAVLDKSGDGVLDRLEIQEGLRNPAIDWELLGFDRDTYEKHIFSVADEDGDNRVSFDEFWQLVLRSVSQREAAKAEAAAQMVSLNDFALWTAEEVGEWLTSVGFGQYVPAFVANNVHGYKLLGGGPATKHFHKCIECE